jgi:hypothetical protein
MRHPTIIQCIKEYGLLVGITMICNWNLTFSTNVFFFNLNFSSSLFHVLENFIKNKILGEKKNKC